MSSNSRSFATQMNRFVYRMSQHWAWVVLIPLGIFTLMPFVAPTLSYVGWNSASQAVYTFYKPFCHQFGFRSFYLFGLQSVYPRANTGTALVTYEDIILETAPSDFAHIQNLYADSSNDSDLMDWANLQWTARDHIGNPTMGYKVAVCERDISIYGALFVGGVLYVIFQKRVRPLPIWLYIWLGLGPIAIDGLSQLLSLPPFEFWAVRETLPMFRVLTGATFGFMNAWLGFPYLKMSFDETRWEIEHKFRRAGITL